MFRAAAIGLGDPGYAEDLCRQAHALAVAEVRRTVSDLVDAGLHCVEASAEPAIAALLKAHAEEPFDALFLMQVAWGRPAVLLQVLRAFPNLPMILYAPGGRIVDGMIHSIAPAAGVGSTIPILRSEGVHFKHVWSVPGETVDEGAFLPFLRAAAAKRRVRGAKLGMVGFGDMRLQTTAFDVQELHRTFGVEVESVDMLQMKKEMDALDPSYVAQQAAELTTGWNYHNNKHPSPTSLETVIAAYLTLDRWAAEQGWLGVSIKCPTGVAQHMGFTPCLVGCLLARKYQFVCENDVPGLLTQVILSSLCGSTSTYWELYEVLADGILLGCCGFCPETFLDEPMKVRVIEEFFTGLGCCAQVKMGPYTLARLGKSSAGKYLFHCAEGEATPPPPWYEVAVGQPQHPSTNFKFDDGSETVLSRVLAQHFAVVPGRWRNAVEEFARLAGIDVI